VTFNTFLHKQLNKTAIALDTCISLTMGPQNLVGTISAQMNQRPVFHLSSRQSFHRICLVFLLLVKPIMATDSPIESSSDVWAAVVANVGPLLILVGEKHVKAYFKVMSGLPHYLLYAVGPIGLITAITTIIRLGGVRSLKRLVGRQYESRAWVLADVTSVSTGEVSYEVQNEVLEQTTNPSDQDTAVFFLQGVKDGSESELRRWLRSDSVRDCLISSRVDPQSGDNLANMDKLSSWYAIIGIFQANTGTTAERLSARKKARKAALMLGDCDDDTEIPPEVLPVPVKGSITFFAGWGGVSLPLTACHGKESALTKAGTSIFCFMCLLSYAGVIAGNWVVQHNILNLVLTTSGLFLSACGAFTAAFIIDKTTEETEVPVENLTFGASACSAGFYSLKRFPGLKLPTCPKVVFISRATSGPPRGGLVLTHFAVMVMTLGYTALYLGLRASEWWASFGIFGVSIAASVARVLLVSDNLKLRKLSNDSGYWPFSIWRSRRDTYSALDPGITINPGASEPTAAHEAVEGKDMQAPFVDGPRYHTIAVKWRFPEAEVNLTRRALDHMDKDGPQMSLYCALTRHSLSIAAHLRERCLMPVELISLPGATDKASSNTQSVPPRVLFSDIICNDGVWRQPLEIIVRPLTGGKGNVCNESLLYLSSWFWNATNFRREAAEGRQPIAAHILRGNFGYIKEFSRPREGGGAQPTLFSPSIGTWGRSKPKGKETGVDGGSEHSSYKLVLMDYIWTAAKILYVLFERTSPREIEQFMGQFHVDLSQAHLKAAHLSLSQEELDEIVLLLERGGLVVKSTCDRPTTSQHHPSSSTS